MRPIKLIIDTDPGVDDAMAILYAAALIGALMMVLVGFYTMRRAWGWVRAGGEGAV